MSLQEPLAGSSSPKTSAAWQSLFSAEPGEREAGSSNKLAQKVVEAILSASFESFPGLLEHVGLPGTVDQLAKMTPYQLAVQVYNRWSTEEQLFDVLGMYTGAFMNESLQEGTRFCVQALLYRFNLQIRPEYRALFLDSFA